MWGVGGMCSFGPLIDPSMVIPVMDMIVTNWIARHSENHEGNKH